MTDGGVGSPIPSATDDGWGVSLNPSVSFIRRRIGPLESHQGQNFLYFFLEEILFLALCLSTDDGWGVGSPIPSATDDGLGVSLNPSVSFIRRRIGPLESHQGQNFLYFFLEEILFLALCLFLLVASLVWSNVFSTFTTGQDKSRVF